MAAALQEITHHFKEQLIAYSRIRAKRFASVWQYCDLETIEKELATPNSLLLQTMAQLSKKIEEHDQSNLFVRLCRRFIYPRRIEEQRHYLYYLKIFQAFAQYPDLEKLMKESILADCQKIIDDISRRYHFKYVIRNLARELSELSKKTLPKQTTTQATASSPYSEECSYKTSFFEGVENNPNEINKIPLIIPTLNPQS